MIVHPVGKLYAVLFALASFLFVHIRVQPYSAKLLNDVDSCCIVMLCVLAAVNLFWANILMSIEIVMPSFEVIGGVFLFFEVVVMILPLILLVVVVLYKVICKLINVYRKRRSKQD